ncbi:alpha/beta fold hydrolase [Patescibacteria group bacterium]|nr:alpha/beta fold hydrolase [Patescibacteria group bacterium]MBU1931413.1 alpha/beta fold hydrolase [Patescibacteria group bacterium]
MKKVIILLLVFLGVGIGLALRFWPENKEMVSPLGKFQSPQEKPLQKYSFPNLNQRGGISSQIAIGEALKQEGKFTSYLFSYTSEGRKITGLFNQPVGEGNFPVIIMLRGWVDQEVYQTGVGTQRAGEVFAQNGFITLAPDFLGYAGSDNPPDDVWEERFLKPVAVLDLLASIKSLPQADVKKIGFWGHSNGGMIALSVLEITGADYPTALWAPVSKPFPYDILFYTDEYEDKGKLLRAKLADFEKDYDVDQYSFDRYLDWLKAPLQIHQGKADDAVPLEWTNELVDRLEELKIDVNYYVYPGADHNMSGSWDQVVSRDLNFFREKL